MTVKTNANKTGTTLIALWVIQGILAIIGSASSLAVSLVLFEESSSATVLAVSTFLGSAAAIYLAPLIGGATDFFSRKTSICAVNILNAVSMACMAWATIVHNMVLMLVFVFLTAICATALALTLQASVRLLRTENDLTKINGFLGLIDSAPVLIGPLVGALIYTLRIPATVFLLDAALSVVGAIVVSLLIWPKQEKPARSRITYFGGNIIQGFKFIYSHKDLWRLQISFAAYNFAAGLCVPVVIVFVLTLPSNTAPEWNLSASNISGAIGLMIGSALVVRYATRISRENMVCGSMFFGSLFGRALLVMASNIWLVLPGMLLRNAMVQTTNAPLTALWQERTPKEIQGIVFGCRRLIGQGLFPIAVALGGVLTDSIATWTGVTQMAAATVVLIIGGTIEVLCACHLRFSSTRSVFRVVPEE